VLKDLERAEQIYQLVAPGLARDFPELRAAVEPPWLVPDAMRTRYFAGRSDLLTRLRQHLVERHRAVLSGLGGIGKTQTAIEYAVRHRADYPAGVFWVNAETNSGLISGFTAVSKALRLPARESDDQEAAVKVALEWLNDNDHWLLILDNVEDRLEVQRFVPERDKGDTLITSRESVFQELGIARALDVQDLDDDEALHFLLARTERDDAESVDRAAAHELTAELGNLPLALEQAAAYIVETNAAFSDYLSAFRKRRVTLLEKAHGLVSHDTVAVTWAANFAAVGAISPAAADVLRVSAFLAPDTIPYELFSKGAQNLGEPIAAALFELDDLVMAELLRPLARYSLIRSDSALRAFGVHRLVQEIVRAAIEESERRTYVERAIAALDAAFPAVEYATWVECERLVPHVVSIAEWVDSSETRLYAASRILSNTGRYLTDRGRYAEAEPLLERALTTAERALGLDHLDVATVLNNLANAYFYRGRYGHAQPLYERALAIRERALGPDHLDVARVLHNLASLHWFHGRYAAAEPLNERVLIVHERELGPDHPRVAHILHNLANVYFGGGRYDEAGTLYERELRIRERALGPDHPDVAYSLDGIADVYMKRRRYDEAQKLYERALAIRESALGTDHPDVAESLTNLAHSYLHQGWCPEAQSLYERALAKWERALGPAHPDVALSLDGLGNVHLKLGRHAEAEPLFERSLAIRERAFGPDHPYLARPLIGLASLRTEQGRNAEAIALFERALAIQEQVLRPDHPLTQATRDRLTELRDS
jgi:tetratricopeptide (TPR) repeat protein